MAIPSQRSVRTTRRSVPTVRLRHVGRGDAGNPFHQAAVRKTYYAEYVARRRQVLSSSRLPLRFPPFDLPAPYLDSRPSNRYSYWIAAAAKV